MKTELFKRVALRVGLVLAILACLSVMFTNLASLRCFNALFDSVCRVETEEKVFALTFSDGPTARGVAQVLPILAAHDAKATFFLSGQKVENELPAAKWLLAAGHELGNQGYSQQVMEERPQDFYASEISKTDALLRKAGAKNPHYFRPPFGIRSVGLLWELHNARYKLVMWDVSDNGQREAPPRAYANAIVAKVTPGSIVMLHALGSDDDEARAALPLILQELEKRGYKAVTVTDLLTRTK